MAKEKIHICPPSEVELARSIVQAELGPDFDVENGMPVNVGIKGDQRFVGDTLLVTTPSRDALRAVINAFDYDNPPSKKDDTIGNVSNQITNKTEASKVLLDITALARSTE